MKTTLALAAFLIGSAAVSDLLAQGQFIWGNRLAGVQAPIYGVPPVGTTPQNEVRRGNTATGIPAGNQTYAGQLLAGTGFTMAIYVGHDASEVMQNNTPPSTLGTATFRTGATVLGFVNQFTSAADGIPGGTPNVNYQFRAWDNLGGTVTSWTQVMARGGTVPSGTSDIYVFDAPLALGGGTPPLTLGIRSFQLTVVPEPSLIALGALGLGALLLRRRK